MHPDLCAPQDAAPHGMRSDVRSHTEVMSEMVKSSDVVVNARRSSAMRWSGLSMLDVDLRRTLRGRCAAARTADSGGGQSFSHECSRQ
jgi:hypothetical protein